MVDGTCGFSSLSCDCQILHGRIIESSSHVELGTNLEVSQNGGTPELRSRRCDLLGTGSPGGSRFGWTGLCHHRCGAHVQASEHPKLQPGGENWLESPWAMSETSAFFEFHAWSSLSPWKWLASAIVLPHVQTNPHGGHWMWIRAMPCLVPLSQLLGNVSIPAFKDSLEHLFNLNKT